MLGTEATSKKMDEKMMMGMTEIKPSRIALRYLLRAIALKKGLALFDGGDELLHAMLLRVGGLATMVAFGVRLPKC